MRLHLDYAAPVWDFQLQKDVDKEAKVCTMNVHKVLIGWK